MKICITLLAFFLYSTSFAALSDGDGPIPISVDSGAGEPIPISSPIPISGPNAVWQGVVEQLADLKPYLWMADFEPYTGPQNSNFLYSVNKIMVDQETGDVFLCAEGACAQVSEQAAEIVSVYLRENDSGKNDPVASWGAEEDGGRSFMIVDIRQETLGTNGNCDDCMDSYQVTGDDAGSSGKLLHQENRGEGQGGVVYIQPQSPDAVTNDQVVTAGYSGPQQSGLPKPQTQGRETDTIL